MKILYLGSAGPHSTSMARAWALMRLGHRVELFDTDKFLPRGRLLTALHFRTGFRLLLNRAARSVRARVADRTFDVVWVNSGQVISRELVRWLRGRAGAVLNYNNDDPFGNRDGRCWDSFKRAVPEYDLLVVLREVNVAEARALGARRVLRVWMSYDPVAHRPRKLTPEQTVRWATDVVFVGTWMPERGPFLRRLVELGVPLSIFGDHWAKAPEWPALAGVHRGPGVLGDDYVATIQCSRIALGLLSKGNRDLHTSRSVEIPYIGGLLCAERTSEHEQMYLANREAVFWDSPEECAERCRQLLGDEATRRRIAAAGRNKVLALKLSTNDIVQRILDAVTTGAVVKSEGPRMVAVAGH